MEIIFGPTPCSFSLHLLVSIDYLLGYSGYYAYVNYNKINLKVNEANYDYIFNNGYIYFDNDNHRCVKLNELMGLDNLDIDYSDLINELYKCCKINEFIDKNNFNKVNEEYVDKVINDVEVILDSKFISFVRDSI